MNSKTIRIILFAFFIILIFGLSIYFFPKILALKNEAERLKLQVYIENIGFWGWLLLLGLIVAQIVIAFLPGEPIEILAGILFGPIVGMLTCMLGAAIGTLIIFALAKTVGMPFIKIFIDEEKLQKYKFINSKEKKDTIVFILFFIPGTPKDIITYFVPFIKMNLWRFILISSFARIPSIITSTISGSSIRSGNWTLTIIMFVVTFIVAIVGILINHVIMKKHMLNEKKHN